MLILIKILPAVVEQRKIHWYKKVFQYFIFEENYNCRDFTFKAISKYYWAIMLKSKFFNEKAIKYNFPFFTAFHSQWSKSLIICNLNVFDLNCMTRGCKIIEPEPAQVLN